MSSSDAEESMWRKGEGEGKEKTGDQREEGKRG
jgi:hypothetical protein